MRFGIFSNGFRQNPLGADSYDEDLIEIVTADRLGFDQAWISEHPGLKPDGVPNPNFIIAKAAAMTKTIKLGPAVRLLPLYNPIDVATEASVCDHLTRGRYMLGVGSGPPVPFLMDPRGLDWTHRHAMVRESIELILRLWEADQPFDHIGEHWPGKGLLLLNKPYQVPHPVVAFATETDEFLTLVGSRGFSLLTSQYENPENISILGDKVTAAATDAGLQPTRDNVIIPRHIYLTDSVKQARLDLRAQVDPDLDVLKRVFASQFKGYMPASGDPADINFDQQVEAGNFIIGDPDTVHDTLRDFYDRSGGFGTLLMVMGKDWSTRDKRIRSMELFAEHVIPRLASLGAPSFAQT